MRQTLLESARWLRARSPRLQRGWALTREPLYRVLELAYPDGIAMPLGEVGQFRLHPRLLGWNLAGYEPEVLDWVQRALSPGDTFLDVGAHLGFHTLAAARRVGSEGRVVAVEPSPSSVELLRRHVAANAAWNVEVVNALVGAEVARVDFTYRPNPTDPGGCANSLAYQIEGGNVIELPVTTLDQLCAVRGLRPALVKIDVEGAEALVLAGAEELLQGVRPRVLCAVHPEPLSALGSSPTALVQWMAARGYRCTGLTGVGLAEPGFEEVVFEPDN